MKTLRNINAVLIFVIRAWFVDLKLWEAVLET